MHINLKLLRRLVAEVHRNADMQSQAAQVFAHGRRNGQWTSVPVSSREAGDKTVHSEQRIAKEFGGREFGGRGLILPRQTLVVQLASVHSCCNYRGPSELAPDSHLCSEVHPCCVFVRQLARV